MNLKLYIEAGRESLLNYTLLSEDRISSITRLLTFVEYTRQRWRLYLLSQDTVSEVWQMLREPENEDVLDALMETTVLFVNAVDLHRELDMKALTGSFTRATVNLRSLKHLGDDAFIERLHANGNDLFADHLWFTWLYFLSQHYHQYAMVPRQGQETR